MIDEILQLEGVTILDRKAIKLVKGRGGCGVYYDNPNDQENKGWYAAPDGNGDGATKDDALYWFHDDHSHYTRWCCDSCPWNQPSLQP